MSGCTPSRRLHLETTLVHTSTRIPAAAGLVPAFCLVTVVASAATTVPEIVVTGRKALPTPATAPRTERTRDDIDRLQPESLFDLVRDVPGVSVNGGPRTSGMRFNIRGFSDTEDVLVDIDGVPRSFEKYRFGSGVFLEPELLQRVTVERSASLARGSGALGGSVSARTRDPADLLADDARLGGLLKSGYASNNDERLLAGTAAARLGSVGLLGSWSRRNSNAARLPDGTRLANSESDGAGGLTKLTWNPGERTAVRVAYTRYESRTLQPYDATGGQPGFFGQVVRDIDDDTLVASVAHSGAGDDWQVELITGQVQTSMRDLLAPGETPFSSPATGNVRDRYDYLTRVIRLDGSGQGSNRAGDWQIRAGLQWLTGDREITRVTDNADINAALYPGGFNAAQPSGGRTTLGGYVEPGWRYGRLTLRAGVRADGYDIDAGPGTRQQLAAVGEATRISFTRLTPAGSAEFALWPDGLRAFYSYSEAFRPPLLDEYFTRGAFGRCIPAFLGSLAPPSGVCGNRYVPESARTRETGLAWTGVGPGDLQVTARVGYFRTAVSNVLESITVVAPDTIGQPGREERSGIEAEFGWEGDRAFGRIGYARLRGRLETPTSSAPLFDLPGDTLTGLIGLRSYDGRFEAGYRLEQVASRRAVIGGSGTQPVIGAQDGYRVHGLFASISPVAWLQLQLTAENLSNERYQLNNGFGGAPGAEAPGRDLRVALFWML
jgi:hemoglobin/transferrin/lactoferrin receptor protein